MPRTGRNHAVVVLVVDEHNMADAGCGLPVEDDFAGLVVL
jgi:hypothetical protein